MAWLYRASPEGNSEVGAHTSVRVLRCSPQRPHLLCARTPGTLGTSSCPVLLSRPDAEGVWVKGGARYQGAGQTETKLVSFEFDPQAEGKSSNETSLRGSWRSSFCGTPQFIPPLLFTLKPAGGKEQK